MDDRDADARRHRLALGAAVRELRARRGLSQEEAGFRGSLHRNYVGAIERGEINPTFRVILKLCEGSTSRWLSWWSSTSVSSWRVNSDAGRNLDTRADRTSDTQLRLVPRLLGRVGAECRRLCPSHPAKSPVALGNEEGGHRCSAPVTPFLDQPKYGSGQVQERALAGCEGHSTSVETSGEAVASWTEWGRSAGAVGGRAEGGGAEVRAGWRGCELGETGERRRGGEGAEWRGWSAVSGMRRSGSHNPDDFVRKGCGT